MRFSWGVVGLTLAIRRIDEDRETKVNEETEEENEENEEADTDL